METEEKRTQVWPLGLRLEPGGNQWCLTVGSLEPDLWGGVRGGAARGAGLVWGAA